MFVSVCVCMPSCVSVYNMSVCRRVCLGRLPRRYSCVYASEGSPGGFHVCMPPCVGVFSMSGACRESLGSQSSSVLPLWCDSHSVAEGKGRYSHTGRVGTCLCGTPYLSARRSGCEPRKSGFEMIRRIYNFNKQVVTL